MDYTFSLICLNLFAILIYIFYKYVTRNNNYWKLRGIPEAKGAKFFFGHFKDVILMKKNIIIFLEDVYKSHKNDSMVGIYRYQKPFLLVKDPDLIKFVLQTGFDSFSGHNSLDKNLDPLLSYDPFFSNDQHWKDVRAYFTSSVSSKKIKILIPAIIDISKKLSNYLNEKLLTNYEIEIEAKNLFSKFTAGVSASIILGLDAQTFVDKDSPDSFRSMMDTLFIPSLFGTLRHSQFLTIINIGFSPNWINKSFQKIVDNILIERKKENIIKNDMLQWIIDQMKYKNEPDKLAAAHAFAFFIEIYETSSLTLSAMSYFLAKNQDIQDKVKNEIDKVIESHGELSYEALNDMIYFEQVLKEAHRFFPPSGKMIKYCTKSVKLKGSDGLIFNLEKGDPVIIPVFALHRDPEYWENPDDFQPERFEKNNENEGFTFLSFGKGPRMCPGMRLAIQQIKIVLSIILKNYVLELSPKMIKPIQIDPKYFLTTIKDGYWIKLHHRQ